MINKVFKFIKLKKEKVVKEKKEKGFVICVVVEGLLFEVISKDEDGCFYGYFYEIIFDKICE